VVAFVVVFIVVLVVFGDGRGAVREKQLIKRWRDLSHAQRAAVVLGGMFQVALMAAALWDLNQRSAGEINGSKQMWTAAAFINYVGPIAYFIFGRKAV